MGTKLNRDAYQRLIDEDLAWLEKQPRSLEREHIKDIVRLSPSREYANATTTPPDLTEQARQLVDDLPDPDCDIPLAYLVEADARILEKRIASALDEAATAALEQERKRILQIIKGSIPANDEKVYALLTQVIAAIGDDKQ